MNKFKNDHLYYLPLGGIGIFGANCYLYRYQNKWIMIDCGLAFNKDLIKYPGIEIMFPDVSFAKDIKKDLLGIICTHGHEDHIGAITSLWSELGCPIYGSEFTIKIIERKLKYDFRKKKHNFPLKIVEPYGVLKLGGFVLDFMPVIHSVPGGFSVRIKAGGKTVVHAGDWRLDDDPILENSDEKQWKKAGDKGVDAFMCDSTDFGEFESGQEKELIKPLSKIFSTTTGCAYVAMFASNIARIKVLIKAANRSGRHVGIVGTSLVQNSKIAESCGLLDYEFLSQDEMASIPKDEMVIALTGAQGQMNSALVKLSEDRLGFLDLEEDDVVILSSRAIPGNEEEIARVTRKIEAYGTKVITSEEEFVHVSGHSSPKHIEQMYKWIRPKTLIAMHGEFEQLNANVNLAKGMKIPKALIVENGEIYDLSEDKVIDKIETGLVCKNHGKIVSTNSSALKEKKQISFNGACIVSVVLNKEHTELLREPQITLLGLDDDKEKSQEIIADFLAEQLDVRKKINKEEIEKIVRARLKQLFKTEKPIIEVHIL